MHCSLVLILNIYVKFAYTNESEGVSFKCLLPLYIPITAFHSHFSFLYYPTHDRPISSNMKVYYIHEVYITFYLIICTQRITSIVHAVLYTL